MSDIVKSLQLLVMAYVLNEDEGYYSHSVPLIKEKLLGDNVELILEYEISNLKVDKK